MTAIPHSASPLVDIIAGARPNFMRIAPILHAIRARQAAGSALRFRLVHTGQHYDERMSGGFFALLGIPQPDVNLEVGSGTCQPGMSMAAVALSNGLNCVFRRT